MATEFDSWESEPEKPWLPNDVLFMMTAFVGALAYFILSGHARWTSAIAAVGVSFLAVFFYAFFEALAKGRTR